MKPRFCAVCREESAEAVFFYGSFYRILPEMTRRTFTDFLKKWVYFLEKYDMLNIVLKEKAYLCRDKDNSTDENVAGGEVSQEAFRDWKKE